MKLLEDMVNIGILSKNATLKILQLEFRDRNEIKIEAKWPVFKIVIGTVHIPNISERRKTLESEL